MRRSIILKASSRPDGDTDHLVNALQVQIACPCIDLSSLSMSYYDYEHKNKDDDYLPCMENIVQYQAIILATPVYWYTMSAQMKVFLDRLSDCLTLRKDLGRALANKSLAVIGTYNNSYPEGFELPFVQTAGYMDMHFLGAYLCDSNLFLSMDFTLFFEPLCSQL